jgi:hypothetical protein
MNASFLSLVKVNFSHDYFAGGVFAGFEPGMSEATRQLVKNEGFIIHFFKGGFSILFDALFAGNPRTREDVLAGNLNFDFTLEPKDPHFYNYTDGIPSDMRQSIFYFRNTDKTPAGMLQADKDAVTAGDLYKYWYFKEWFSRKPFAKISLAIVPGLAEEYTIKFRARTTFLRYILVSREISPMSNLAVINSSSAQVCCTPSKVKLPDNTTVNGFISNEPVKLSQQPDQGGILQLVENFREGSDNYKVLIRALPFPDVRTLSAVAKPEHNTNHISDIFI